MAENKNRPPSGSIIEEALIRKQLIWEDEKLIENKKIVSTVYNYSVDENGLPINDYRSYEPSHKKREGLFADLINKKKEKSTPPQ